MNAVGSVAAMNSYLWSLLVGASLLLSGCKAAPQPALSRGTAQPVCRQRCDVSLCPSPSCLHGYAKDRCRCCLVCAAAEGQACGRAHDVDCGDGMQCKPLFGKRAAKGPGVCRCKLNYKVCGDDGKTYDNVCKLKSSSRRALQLRLQAVVQVHKGACEPDHSHPNSPRYKFNFIADVVEKIAPAVVHIELVLRHPLLRRNIPLSSGSGFIISERGLIVTNAHVVVPTNNVMSGQQMINVHGHNGKIYEATIKDIDTKADIATIKINSKRKQHVLPLGRSVELRPGEFVVAIGSPFALQNTVTTGIVSSAQRDGRELGLKDSDMDYIQTDAIINYGNSGGPLVNLDGEVIGINTLKVTAGISFAIPSDRIAKFLTDFLHKRTKVTGVKKRFIGVRMLTLTPALIKELKKKNSDFPDITTGIYVHEVILNSPAYRSGIQNGDVIVKVNGIPLKTTNDLQEAVKNEFPLLLEVRRGNEDILFNIEPDLIG
ncbi:serine protease HTRA3a isoform X2 [Leucoraja erinacea]|uniref:serine protease HTRA3a isoform X2 n=1 Tax=Leucoraja erinaceus TaxID=7782 RepID=UPI002453AD0A|nr:serine protease HTRA3a isoform X2 [Leucoraja erinacea]